MPTAEQRWDTVPYEGTKMLQLHGAKVETVKRVFCIRREWPNATLQKIADILNAEAHLTTQGMMFTPT